MKKYCFGVDVGGTTIKLGLFTVEGKLLEKWDGCLTLLFNIISQKSFI